jgi:putative PEP-CTERM system TPR-repeat lipoprotein
MASPLRPWPMGRRGRDAGILMLVLMLLLVLAGCGRSVNDRLGQVRTLIERQDRAAAMVAVKALLQDKPDLGEARVLLGQLLLDRGEAAAAEIELRRALELGQPEAVVVPVLARSLLAANQGARLLSQFGRTSLPDALATAQLKTTLAEAEAGANQLEAARDSLALALRAVPGHEPALLLRARVTAVAGDLPSAMAEVETLLAANPKSADGWVLKGDLLARQRAEPAALVQAYQQALAAKPDHAGAHTALVTLYLTTRDLDAARTQHAAMRKLLPRHPQTLLFDGQMALLKGDLPQARELFQLLLRSMPDNLVLLQSAGVVELRLNAPGQAELLLSRAVQLAPNSPNARRLAAQAYLSLGQPARALAVLEPLTGKQAADAEALTLAAQARLLGGDAALAASLFERAAKLQPNDPKIRTALALSHLQRGQGESALAELQRVAADDSTGTSADLALIAAQLQRRAFDPALQAIAALARKQPDLPLPAHLRGQVLLAKRDVAGARAAFEQALAKDADYFPALTALAGLDLADKQPDAARARFQALIKRNPRNGPAYLALAELGMRTGAGRDAVAAQLEAGIKASPDDATLRLALASHHLETSNPKAALAAAQAGLARLPDHFELLGRLGQAQLLTGDSQQALTTFNRMVALQGRSPLGHIGLAEAQMAANDLGSAGRSLKRALELEPEHLPAQRLQVMLALRQKQPGQALAVARQVQKQRPALAAGYLLEGEVQIVQQQWPAAVVALRQAAARAEPQQSAARLHYALLQAGQSAEAEAMAAAWIKAHPRDLLFLFHLGDQALARKDLAVAEARYRAVLDVSPEHALSLNNVAWLMLEQKKPGALAYAERAVKASPDRPALRDTLAHALAAEGRLPQALEMQKSALALRPDDPYLRLNLARLHAQAGEKKLAKAELDRLALLGDRFPRQADVAAALKALGGR